MEEALRLSAKALERAPGDRTAQWNRAVALEKNTFTRLAQADFEALGQSGDATWSRAAQERAQALQSMDEAIRRAWQDLMDRGREMVAGGPIPIELVKRFPGQMRLFSMMLGARRERPSGLPRYVRSHKPWIGTSAGVCSNATWAGVAA
ncbi:MAG: hypothetical protein HC821_02620, partial [Lewinella sp.]|nr:hypothetical protein [Lewinella sp.]